MKLRKMMALLLALCTVLFLAGCDGGGGSDDDDGSDATWPVEFYSEVGGGSPVSSMRTAPATGTYKYIYFNENNTYESGDLNNGTLTKTGEGTYSGGDPHNNITISLTGTFEGSSLSGESVKIGSGALTIAGINFTRGSSSSGGSDDGTPIQAYAGLCFTANTAGSTVATEIEGTVVPLPVLEYSTDGTTWNTFTLGAEGTKITLANAGDKVYFRGDNNSFSIDSENRILFKMTGSIAASGNIMSLVDKTCTSKTIPNDCCFIYLFQACSSLTTAPELPATTLAASCYNAMFFGCISLIKAPELPATTLTSHCYADMFNGCSSLTTAPELPATDLVDHCYFQMFTGCSSLIKAPELPATTLEEGCYESMFYLCTSLNYIKVHFTDWAPASATLSWVDGVPTTGTFYCPADLVDPDVDGDFGTSKAPQNSSNKWTVLSF